MNRLFAKEQTVKHLMWKKFLAIFLVLSIVDTFSFNVKTFFSVVALAGETNSLYAGGSGTEEDPYLIETAEQLDNVRYNLDAFFVQNADIDLSQFSDWKPIGEALSQEYIDYFQIADAEKDAFSGSYDGNGFSISNLSINSPYYEYVGLFGLSYGQLCNITLTNININIDRDCIDFSDMYNNVLHTNLWVGGIVGYSTAEYNYMSHPIISNCKVDGSISVKNTNDIKLGGIVGVGQVTDCVNNAEITVLCNKDGRYEKDADASVGGIIGESSTVNGIVMRCINYGAINVISGTYAKVGGISGKHGQVKYCVNYSDIYGAVIGHSGYSGFEDNVNVGGIFGANSSDMNDHLANYGNVTAYASCDDSWSLSGCAGGIAGFNGYYSSGYIEKSYNLCDEVKAGPYDFTAGRICGGEGGYEKLFDNNYSIETTLTNGIIPTEFVTVDGINGASMSREEIEPFVNNILNIIALKLDGEYGSESVLTATYYNNGLEADIDSISLYESALQLNLPPLIDVTATSDLSGDISLKKLDSDENCSDLISEFFVEEDKNNIAIILYWRFLEPNTTYYFDLSNLVIAGQTYPADCDYEKLYSFTTDFGLTKDQVFTFNNEISNFIAKGENEIYHISPEFYDKELSQLSLCKRSKIKNSINKKWNGSCYGMSLVMMLADNFALTGGIAANYPVPSSDDGRAAYGSRDKINYYQVMQDYIPRNKIKDLNDIFEMASSINSIQDVFEMRYSYNEKKDLSGFKFNATVSHAVVVVGASHDYNGDYLYLFDPNYMDIIKRQVFCDDSAMMIGSEVIDIFDVDYISLLQLASFVPDTIEDKTYFNTVIDNAVFIAVENATKNIAKIYSDLTHEGDLIPDDTFYLANGNSSSEMAVILPPEDYYEISSDTGALDYSVVNNNMFFAARADHAEKSIVSAEDGAKLLNVLGSYELTISARHDNMPYDMFSVLGSADGDVVCEYTDEGVKVSADNYSDIKVTLFADLEETEYIVSKDYDNFIVGEKDNKGVILVDMDNDGIFETDIIDAPMGTYTLTIPDTGVTVTRTETLLSNGAEIKTGDRLLISVNPPEGQKIDFLRVNGVDFENNSVFVVEDTDVVITVGFVPVATMLTVNFPENVTVERDGASLKSGDEILSGERLKITAVPPDGYTLTSLKVNGVDFTSSEIFTVDNVSVIIIADFTLTDEKKLTVTFPENVIVTRTEKFLSSGDEVFTGDVLMITAVPPEGYKLNSLTVNDNEMPNESRYTVGGESVVIKAEFVEETVIITPVSIKIATLPRKITYYLNETFNVKGCSIDVTFSDVSVKNIAVTNDMISGFDSSTTGTKTITVTYEGITATFEVTVKRRSSDTSSTPSRPYTPSEPDDNSLSSGELHNWSDVAEALPGYSGKTLTVNINNDTVVPAVVIKALYDNNATLRAVANDGYIWIIEGGKVNGLISAIDLEIGVGGYIPSYLIENIGGADAKRLNIRFDNQHRASLSFAVDAGYSGQYASLMRVNDGLSELEFVGSCVVGTNGSVCFTPDKSGDYIVIVDTETKLFCDVNNDGVLDTNDVSDLLRYIVGLLDSLNRRNLDHNGDGMVNANDAAYIFKKFEDENELV